MWIYERKKRINFNFYRIPYFAKYSWPLLLYFSKNSCFFAMKRDLLWTSFNTLDPYCSPKQEILGGKYFKSFWGIKVSTRLKKCSTYSMYKKIVYVKKGPCKWSNFWNPYLGSNRCLWQLFWNICSFLTTFIICHGIDVLDGTMRAQFLSTVWVDKARLRVPLKNCPSGIQTIDL